MTIRRSPSWRAYMLELMAWPALAAAIVSGIAAYRAAARWWLEIDAAMLAASQGITIRDAYSGPGIVQVAILVGVAASLTAFWFRFGRRHLKGDWPGRPLAHPEGRPLADVLAEAERVNGMIETSISPYNTIPETIAGQPGSALGLLLALPYLLAVKDQRYQIRVVRYRDGVVDLWETPRKHTLAFCEHALNGGECDVVKMWEVPITDVPDLIEVQSAAGHIPNLAEPFASRFEDVFFTWRGRRMVMSRQYNLVRDAAMERRYQLKSFIDSIKAERRKVANRFPSGLNTFSAVPPKVPDAAEVPAPSEVPRQPQPPQSPRRRKGTAD